MTKKNKLKQRGFYKKPKFDFVSRHKGIFIFSLIIISIFIYVTATNYGDQFGINIGALTAKNATSPSGTFDILSVSNNTKGTITTNLTSEDGTLEIPSNIAVTGNGTISENLTVTKQFYVGENITQPAGARHCFNSTCGSYIYDNGTDLVIAKD